MAPLFEDIDLSPLGGRKRFDAAFGIANRLFPDTKTKLGWQDALLHMGRGISAGGGSGLSGTARLGMGMTSLSDEFLARRQARKELEQRRAQLAMGLLPLMEQREGRLFNQSLALDRLAWDKERFGLEQGQRESEFARRLGLDTDRFGLEQSKFVVDTDLAQQRIDNQARQHAERLGYDYDALSQADKQFFVNQARMGDEFDRRLGFDEESLAQAQGQFEDRLGFDRESLAQNQAQFEDRLGFDETKFGVESAMEQERIDNQARQFAERLGFDYDSLSQNDRQFLARQAQEADQFDRRLAFDETGQVIQDQQFWGRLGQEASQFDRRLAQDADQFAIETDLGQQRITNQEEQFNRTFAQEADEFAINTDLAQQRIDQGWAELGLDKDKWLAELSKPAGGRGGTESERDMSALMRIAAKGDYNALSADDKFEFNSSLGRLRDTNNIKLTDPNDPTKEITVPWDAKDVIGDLWDSHPEFMQTFTGESQRGQKAVSNEAKVLFPELTEAETDARLGDRLGTGRPDGIPEALNDMVLADKLGGDANIDTGFDYSYLTGNAKHDTNELFRQLGKEAKWSPAETRAVHPKQTRETVVEPVEETDTATGQTRIIGGREVPVLDSKTKKMEITAARRIAMGKLSLSAIDTASEVLFPDGKWGGWTQSAKSIFPWTQAARAYNTYSTAVNQFLREQSGAVINDREYAYADGLFVPKWYDSNEKATQRREMLRQYWTTMIEQLAQDPNAIVTNVTTWAQNNSLAKEVEQWDKEQGLGALVPMEGGGFQQPAPPGEGGNTSEAPTANSEYLNYLQENM